MANLDTWTIVNNHKKRRKKIKFSLDDSEYKSLDLLSQTIYDILKDNKDYVPASYITKMANLILEKNYKKQDIGNKLYDGPLNKYLLKTGNKPTRWALISYIKQE